MFPPYRNPILHNTPRINPSRMRPFRLPMHHTDKPSSRITIHVFNSLLPHITETL